MSFGTVVDATDLVSPLREVAAAATPSDVATRAVHAARGMLEADIAIFARGPAASVRIEAAAGTIIAAGTPWALRADCPSPMAYVVEDLGEDERVDPALRELLMARGASGGLVAQARDQSRDVIVVMAALTRSDRCASDEKLPTLLELASLVVEIDGRVAELERGQRMAAAQRSAVEAARTRTDPYEIVDAAARALRVGLSLDRDPASGDARVRWTGTGERPDDADLEMLAAVVSIAIARDRAAFEVEERLSYGLVRALLTGDAARASELEDRARLLGIDLREPRAVVTLRTNGLLSRRLLERITREAPQEGLVTVQDDVVVVLWPAERASDLATLRGEVEQMLRRIAPGSLWAGVGRVCRASSDYAVSSRESLFAMHTARQSPDLRHVIDADELGMYRLAAQVVASESAREAVVDALGPLIKIDEKSTSQLLPTLRAYLEHDRRIAETARVLHIHPNTLRYRIDQINQLLDVDFDDPDCRFHLILALRLAVITGVADMAGAAISAQIAEVARAELGGSAQLASRSS